MPVIADTAYPRLPAEPGPAELDAFTPEPAELAFARQKTRQPGPRLALLVLLKTFQHLGRIVRLADVPAGVIGHIAAIAGLAGNTGELVGYGDTTYRVRLAALVRGYVGVTGYDRDARGIAARACVEAARTRDDLADIVNAGIEELLRQRRELPAFGALRKLARAARALVNRSYHRRIAVALPPEACERLTALLVVPESANRSGWDQVKADPPRPSPQRMREHLAHLAWLRGQAAVNDVFSGVPDRKLRHFAAEAHSLGAADLGHMVESKRLALMAALLRGQVAQALDDAAEMFVRLMTRMHNRAKEALADTEHWLNLDFVAENRSLLQPSTVHSDTHGQSAAIFGLAHLLGIELMPRIRSWQDLHLFRPDAGARYEHIDGLFTATIDWPLIEAHLPDMLRVALSIRAGRLLPSAILRRLATYSRKNRLYFAFRELGRAVRTDFLLRYLSSIELRRAIGATTNKSELFNRYAQWVAFGDSGLATAAERDEQRKMVKYNHLVANLLIFHTAVGMTRALDEIAAEGHGAAITPEALASTSPYLNEHLNRFGSYELDLSKPPPPLPFELPPRLQPSRHGAAASV